MAAASQANRSTHHAWTASRSPTGQLQTQSPTSSGSHQHQGMRSTERASRRHLTLHLLQDASWNDGWSLLMNAVRPRRSCHFLCRCFFCVFQWMFKYLHHLHCSPPFAHPLLLWRMSRTDDGSGSAARRSQDVGSGSRFWKRGGSVRPVRDAAAWASLWIQKHLRGHADQSWRRFWFFSRVLAWWTSALYFSELNICLNKWPLICVIILAGLKAKSSITYKHVCEPNIYSKTFSTGKLSDNIMIR